MVNGPAPERTQLHVRVRAFIESCPLHEGLRAGFDELALEVLAYQAAHVPAYARLLAAHGVHPRSAKGVGELPAVPTDAFRLTRIAAQDPEDDIVVFRTSGTSGGARGAHALSTTETYEAAALRWGEFGLFADRPARLTAVVIGAPFRGAGGAGESSLAFMIDLFAERFTRTVHHVQVTQGSPIEGRALLDTCRRAAEQGPLWIAGTSFAFVHALDALAGERVSLPPGSRAMHTGGFKGRSREVSPEELRKSIAATFALSEAAVVGEYGMTELSSQLYEGTLRAEQGLASSARHGVFVPPPWMRVVPVHPATLAPVAPGEVGILRFEDLANVDGALVVQTADQGRMTELGVELLGRAPGAIPRGCSLAIDELLSPT